MSVIEIQSGRIITLLRLSEPANTVGRKNHNSKGTPAKFDLPIRTLKNLRCNLS